MPQKIQGTNRWDIRAIDAALDRNSNLPMTFETEADPAREYEKWKQGT